MKDWMKKVDVLKRVCVSDTTLNRWMAADQFPRPVVRLGPKAPRWSRTAVESWLAARMETTSAAS